MTTVTPEDLAARARALAERVEADRPESWQPHDPALGHPQLLVGVMVRIDAGETVWGPTQILTLRAGEGDQVKDWAVWLFHQVLADEMKRLAPQPGELLAIKYCGTVTREPPAKPYESFRVEVDRAGGTVDWATIGERHTDQREQPAAAKPPAPRPPDEPQDDRQAAAGADPLACDQCGYRAPEHAVGCPNEIPF